jgi:hypothetical protein
MGFKISTTKLISLKNCVKKNCYHNEFTVYTSLIFSSLLIDENLRLWNATDGESNETSEQQDPAKGRREGAHQGKVEEQDGAQGERLFAAVLVAQHAPKRRAQHHPQKHHLVSKQNQILILIYMASVAFSHTHNQVSFHQST